MKLRSKLMFGLVGVLVVLALSPSSFAQVNITISPDTSAAEIQTNRAAQTAIPGQTGAGILVQGQVIAPSGLTTTQLRLTFPSPITSSPGSAVGIPSGDPIRIEGQTGVFATVGGTPVLNTVSSRIEIDLPGLPSTNPNTQGGTFRLVGVRIDANGKTAPVSVTAALRDSVTNYNLTNTSATVITALSAGLASLTQGVRSGQMNLGTATIFTNRSVPSGGGKASFLINEGFASAFRSRMQEGNSGVDIGPNPSYNSTRVKLTFNNVPTGVTLTLSIDTPDGTGSSALSARFGSEGAPSSSATITSSANTATVVILNSSLTTVESINVNIASITVSSTAAVTTAGSITVSAGLSPVCDTNLDPATGLPTAANGYPCFGAGVDVGPLTVVNIIPTNTTMLMPYAAVLPPFDTGLAVANTTADPFVATGGGATPSAGTIRLDFFPTASAGGAGTSFSLTTSATVRPGAGLSSDGTLAAGATWTVLFSQLLTAAGQTGNFIGYVFIQANFLNAHGTATISDFRTYSLTSNVLVLLPPATSSRSSVSAEALDF